MGFDSPTPGGGEGILLASSTAPASIIRRADAFLTGTNDEQVVAQAVAGLPTQGGDIVFAGRLIPSAPLPIFRDGVTLRSIGPGQPTGGSNYRTAAITSGGLIRPAAGFTGDFVVDCRTIGNDMNASPCYTTLTGSVSAGQATISVANTTGFYSAGWFLLNGVYVSYTGVTATTFTGCSGAPAASAGTYVYKSGQVTTTTTATGSAGDVTLPLTSVAGLPALTRCTLNGALAGGETTVPVTYANSLAQDFEPSGRLLITKAAAAPANPTYITYTGISGQSFTGCSGVPASDTASTVDRVNIGSLYDENTGSGRDVSWTGISGLSLTGVRPAAGQDPAPAIGSIAHNFSAGIRFDYGPGGTGGLTTQSGRTLGGITLEDFSIDGSAVASPFLDAGGIFWAVFKGNIRGVKVFRVRRNAYTFNGLGGAVAGTIGAWNNKTRDCESGSIGGTHWYVVSGSSDNMFEEIIVSGRIDSAHGDYGVYQESSPGNQWDIVHANSCNLALFKGHARQLRFTNFRFANSYGGGFDLDGAGIEGLDFNISAGGFRDLSTGTGATSPVKAHVRIRPIIPPDATAQTVRGGVIGDIDFSLYSDDNATDYLIYADDPAAGAGGVGTTIGLQVGPISQAFVSPATKTYNVDDIYLPAGAGMRIIPDDRVIAKAGNYTLTARDLCVLVSAVGTITLPTAVGVTGKTYVVKRTGAGAVTIATTGGQTIDGAATVVLATIQDTVQVVSDGANWQIIGERPAALGL